MRNLLLAAALAAGGAQAYAQTANGVIEGRAINSATQASLPGVQITLTAPPPNSTASNLSADAAARLAEQISALIESGNRAGVGQEAIDNAVANAQRTAGGVVGTQTTILVDGEGRFSFKDLAPGRYNIRATREGYFGSPVNGTAPAAVARTVTIEAGKPTASVEVSLTQGGIISGRVRDPNGQALSGIQVTAYRVTYTSGRKTWSSVNSKATDDRGEYRMFWLAPGEYYIGVTPRVAGAVPGPQDSWARTFYPGVTEPEAATLIVINKGGETAGIDISIRTGTAAMFKISGVARNPFAPPNATTGATDQSVSSFILSPRAPGVLDGVNPPSVTNSIPVNARPNGEFEIRNVRAGSYDLMPYFMQGGTSIVNGAITQSTAPIRRYMISHNPIEVRNADVAGMTISVHPGVTLSGEVTVTGSGPQPIKLESVRLGLRNLGMMPLAFSTIIGALQLDGAGKFTTSGVPQERYAFTVTGIPDSAFVADVRQGGTSVFDSGFVLDDNANPVQVVLDAGGVQVDGTVLNAERKPVSGATVVLVPPVARRQNSLLYKNVQSDDSGHFTVKGVPPGQYTVYAWESILPSAWQNAEYLSNYDGRGRPLTVEKQSHPEVEVSLIPAETRR